MSEPKRVLQNAKEYFGKEITLYPSSRKDKKYMIQKPDGKMVHFGQQGAEDFTFHQNKIRRQNYLNRAMNIKGKWKDDMYSPNNLSINLLWQ
jgi:2-phospho-L-lactate transferase/gluconeogenesis factor (CofD/UPF0052 family)